MRKRYSIVFLVLMAIIVFLLIYVYKLSYEKAIVEREEERLEEILDLDEYYYIKDIDGYVTVYMADEETIYEYTSILTNELPDDIRKDLKSGIKVDDLGEVYGFLENYSS